MESVALQVRRTERIDARERTNTTRAKVVDLDKVMIAMVVAWEK